MGRSTAGSYVGSKPMQGSWAHLPGLIRRRFLHLHAPPLVTGCCQRPPPPPLSYFNTTTAPTWAPTRCRPPIGQRRDSGRRLVCSHLLSAPLTGPLLGFGPHSLSRSAAASRLSAGRPCRATHLQHPGWLARLLRSALLAAGGSRVGGGATAASVHVSASTGCCCISSWPLAGSIAALASLSLACSWTAVGGCSGVGSGVTTASTHVSASTGCRRIGSWPLAANVSALASLPLARSYLAVSRASGRGFGRRWPAAARPACRGLAAGRSLGAGAPLLPPARPSLKARRGIAVIRLLQGGLVSLCLLCRVMPDTLQVQRSGMSVSPTTKLLMVQQLASQEVLLRPQDYEDPV